jgi:pyrroloquinoline quinone (PQQ) biosynthesis protein C
MILQIQASGSPLALIADDANRQENRLLEHPVWVAAFNGTLPKARLKRLLLAILPAVAGPGRYAFAAKVSQIDAQDGKALFMQLFDSIKDPEANADEGWRRVLLGLGASDREIRAAVATPSAEAQDLVDVIRSHGLSSSAVEAAVIAFMLERHFPQLWGKLAVSLEKHYGVPKAQLSYLHREAQRGDDVDHWVDHLIDKYVATAESYIVYEGRRAGREAVWAWTVLIESAA